MRRCFTKDNVCDSTLSPILLVFRARKICLGRRHVSLFLHMLEASHFPDPNLFALSVLWLCLGAPAETQVVAVLGAVHKHAPGTTLVRTGTRLMQICKLFLSLYHTPTHITYSWHKHPHGLFPTLQKGPAEIAWLCGSGWSCCSEQVQTDREIAIATEVVCEIPGNCSSSSSSSSPTHSGPFSDFFPLFFPKVLVPVHSLCWAPREMLWKQPAGLR